MTTKHLRSQLSQTEIVTLAVLSVGGGSGIVDTEDIAVEAHRLAPTRFCWRKYPDQVNLELVRVFLSDAKKAGKSWLDGSGNKGWSLTPAGLQWARDNEHRLGATAQARKRSEMRSGSPTERRWRRERVRIQSSPAWLAWSCGAKQLEAKEACDVFRIDSYAVGQLRSLKVSRLLTLFEADEEIKPFLQLAARSVPYDTEG